jgi:GTP 3',8-cyclase
MVLIDGFGRTHTYLRIAVTDRCNLNCAYCMPSAGFHRRPREEILTLEEMLRVARIAVGMGVDKIRLTGGEPTLRRDLEWLIAELVALPGLQTLGLTTNGLLLKEKAQSLRDAGMRALNVSLDTLKRDRFERITGRDGLTNVLDGIGAALQAGFSPLKLNVVVIAGVNDGELPGFVAFVRERPVNVRFIEFMPFTGNGWTADRVVPWRAMKSIVERNTPLIPLEPTGTIAKEFRVAGHAGTVSFISPLSDEFCGACNRLRLTADGAIKSCLLHPAEVELRHALRAGANDDDIAAMIRGALVRKNFAHPRDRELMANTKRSMAAIGG